jgi:hypothetical protein
MTVTSEVLGRDPTRSQVGDTVTGQAGPACVTVTDLSATLTVPVRALVPVLAASVSVTDPLPRPEAGLTAIHDAAVEVAQSQLVGVATLTPIVPAVAPTDTVVGVTEDVQTIPAWLMVIDCPATVTVPVRGLVLVLAAMLTVADPPPLPEVGLTVIHAAPLDVVQPQPVGAVTVTVEAVPPASTDSVVGEAENMQATPACVTVTDRPATRAVPAREALPGLAVTVSVTVPLPLPDAGFTVIHDVPLDAVQPQPSGAVTATLALPASASTDSEVGATENVQALPAWVTVTVWPATVAVPVREPVLVLAATVNVTAPTPLPDAGPTVIHAAPLDAVQPHSDGLVTITDVLPAPAPADSVVGETENVQPMPACVTVTDWPATVAVPVRGLAPVLAAYVSVTDPFPLPDAGLTTIHAVPLDAVQPQPAGAVTATLAVPASAPADSVAGEAENVQSTPACVTVTVWPATVAVPVRALELVFAAIVSVTVPPPLPDAGLTVIHDVPLDADQSQPAGLVTVTEEVPDPAPTDSVAGEAENVQATPACVTVTVCPATVAVPVRALELVLAATVSVTVPPPLPDAGLTVIHDAPLDAVQPHPAGLVTVTEDVPAPAPTDTVVGEAENVQATPACVTVTVCPATVTVPVRALELVFAATVSVTVPPPLPDAGLTVIHDAPLDAVHAHPVPAATVTDALAAPAATDTVAGEMLNVQPPSSMVNWFDTALRPVPLGPTAATRDS